MPDKEHLIRIEAKMDAGFATVNGHLMKMAESQGEQRGIQKGHNTQLAWIWAIVSGSALAAITALIRSVT